MVSEKNFSQASASKDGLMDVLRQASNFDFDAFQNTMSISEKERTLDPVVTWLRARKHANATNELPPSDFSTTDYSLCFG